MARKSVVLIALFFMLYVRQARADSIEEQEIREILDPSIIRQPGNNATTSGPATTGSGVAPVPLTTESNVTVTTGDIPLTTEGSFPLTTQSITTGTTGVVYPDTTTFVPPSFGSTSLDGAGSTTTTGNGGNGDYEALNRSEATVLVVFLRVYCYPVVSFFIAVLTAASVYRRRRPILRSPMTLIPFVLCGLIILFYWMLIMIGVGEDARSDWIVYMFFSELYIFVLVKEIYFQYWIPIFRAPSIVVSNTVELTVTLKRDPAGAQEQGGWDVPESEWV